MPASSGRGRRRGLILLAGSLGLAGIAGLVAGCGAPLPRVADPGDGSSVLCGLHEENALAGIRSYRDVLPNTRFRERGSSEPAVPLTPLVVVGEVVAVAPGPGWTEAGDQVGFDDASALWRHVYATVSVGEVIGSVGWAAETVTVAFPVGVDEELDAAGQRLESAGRSVFPLYRPTGPEQTPGVWSVGPVNAVLLAEVGSGGRLALPCVPPRREAELLVDVPTLADLRRAAAAPLRERVVRVTALH